jgi:hypothetical protein
VPVIGISENHAIYYSRLKKPTQYYHVWESSIWGFLLMEVVSFAFLYIMQDYCRVNDTNYDTRSLYII